MPHPGQPGPRLARNGDGYGQLQNQAGPLPLQVPQGIPPDMLRRPIFLAQMDPLDLVDYAYRQMGSRRHMEDSVLQGLNSNFPHGQPPTSHN